MSNLLFASSLSKVDGMIYRHELKPKHGSGATADALMGNQKWTQPRWHWRLETLFPYLEYALPSHRHWHEVNRAEFLSPVEEPPVKLVAVPKTAATPRLIAEEPTCMQYVQQAIMRPLVASLESEESSRDFVGFTEQWPNKAMAQCGSDDGSVATLDLSEASDRVANWLVEDLFADFPHFLEGIQACRSTHSRLPSGEVIPLLKFASMGSALTFPIETMVFTAIALEGVLRQNGHAPTAAAIRRYRGMVRVYGDDIIVPTDCAETVASNLVTFGFKVNERKSFWTGEFRESCGGDYWRGYDVSYVKFRRRFPSSLHDVDELVSTVATRNLLYKEGLEATAELLDAWLVPLMKGHYPYVLDTSPVLGRVHKSGLYQVDSMHPDLHAPRVKGWMVAPRSPYNAIEDIPALMKCLLEAIGTPNTDEEHLTRSGRPWAVSIKLRKASPF